MILRGKITLLTPMHRILLPRLCQKDARRALALAGLAWLASPASATGLSNSGTARIVLVGDSITGHSRNDTGGFANLMQQAIQAAYPGSSQVIAALGGSGQSVESWMNVEQTSLTQAVYLDVAGVDVQAELAKPTDLLVIMLGMNNVLAPYTDETETSVNTWIAHYETLATRLQLRAPAQHLALAGITPCTEDPLSRKNLLIARMNAKVQALAVKLNALYFQTSEQEQAVLQLGRNVNPAFHITTDYVHPSDAGHIAIARAMLDGMGETAASQWIVTQKLNPLLATSTVSGGISWELVSANRVANSPNFAFQMRYHFATAGGSVVPPAGWQAVPAVLAGTSGDFQLVGNPDRLSNEFSLQSGQSVAAGQLPAPWMVTAGVSGNWGGGVYNPANNQTALDPVVAASATDLTLMTGGKLSWRPNFATVNYTGSNNTNSVDFAAVTHAANFEGGYGLRWIYSEIDRQVNVEVKSQVFSGTIYLAVSLNGAAVYQNLITSEPGKTKSVVATLNRGWNTLAFKISHYQWQWQASVGLSAVSGDSLDALRLSADYPPPTGPDALGVAPGGTGVQLQWADHSNNELGFEVGRRVANGTWTSLQTVAANTTRHTDSTALPGVYYQYRVRAVGTAGNSSWAVTNGLQHTGVATVDSPVWSADSVVFNQAAALSELSYVPAGFMYSTAPRPLVTGQTLTAVHNDQSGWLGMKFTVGASPITVRELGRWVIAGNTGTHIVKLVDAATSTDVPGGSATVATAGAPAGFKYATLAAPLTLAANTSYCLVSRESAGGDQWYDGACALTYPTGLATVTTPIWSPAGTTYYNGYGAGYGAKTCYGPLALTYSATPVAAFTTGHSMSTLRNDVTGWFGMKLSVGASDLLTSQLGRWVVTGNSATHAVKLVNAATGVDVATAVVATAGAPAGQFQYTPLATAVTLTANTSYYLLSQESAGGDQWYDFTTPAAGSATSYQAWLLANGLPMDASGAGGATASPANDQLPNLVKYALGLTPSVSGHGGRLANGKTTAGGSDYLTLSYTRPEPAPAGSSCAVEAAANLAAATWTTAGLAEINSSVSNGLRTVTVRDAVPMAGTGKRFMRLRVSQP